MSAILDRHPTALHRPVPPSTLSTWQSAHRLVARTRDASVTARTVKYTHTDNSERPWSPLDPSGARNSPRLKQRQSGKGKKRNSSMFLSNGYKRVMETTEFGGFNCILSLSSFSEEPRQSSAGFALFEDTCRVGVKTLK